MREVSIIYQKMKRKSLLFSTMSYLRDCIVYFLPIKRLPLLIRKLLYGDISFVFFIHPRRTEDVYLALPFFSLLRRFLSERTIVSIAKKVPPGVVSYLKTERAMGVVVSSVMLPESLMEDRKYALQSAIKAIRFCKRISGKNAPVGLGAWWPILSRRGLEFSQKLSGDDVVITNGHFGTLLSIYMMTEKIAKIGGLKLFDLGVAVFGAGKMGENVARAFNGKVPLMTLIDINQKKLEVLSAVLSKEGNGKTKISTALNDGTKSIREVLDRHHLAICVTSNIDIAIKEADIPENFIVIDDSRPEAISRRVDPEKKIILEGGLMKIEGAETNYDYGFGKGDNVFGCLAETYALAVDSAHSLKPTIGDVEISDLDQAIEAYKANGISVGDFKTGDRVISDDKIRSIMALRSARIKDLKKDQ